MHRLADRPLAVLGFVAKLRSSVVAPLGSLNVIVVAWIMASSRSTGEASIMPAAILSNSQA